MKSRSEVNSICESTSKRALYLDSAYKQLLHQEQQTAALQNRTKALGLSQEHIFRQVENKQARDAHLHAVQLSRSQEVALVQRSRKKKLELERSLKEENERKRSQHDKQMSCVSLEIAEKCAKVRDQMLKMRKENYQTIESGRQAELRKKRAVRNRIHQNLAESRTTIKNFFQMKHEAIVKQNQAEIKQLNRSRAKQEIKCLNESQKIVQHMQRKMHILKNHLADSRTSPSIIKSPSGLSRVQSQSLILSRETSPQQESQVLVRRINQVLKTYTRL